MLAGKSLDERLVSADVQRSNAEKAEKLAAVEREAATRETNAAAHRQAEARLRAQEATHRKAAQDADTLARQESANRAAAKERAANLRAQQAKSLEQREQRVLEAVGAERRRIIAQAEAENERIEEAKALKLLTARKKKAASEMAQAAETARQEALARQEAQAAETERQRLSMDRAQQLAAKQKYKKQTEQAEAQAARNAADAEAEKIAREEARAEFLLRSTVASVTRARNAEEAERLATIQREATEREREVAKKAAEDAKKAARHKKELFEAKVARQQLEQLDLIWEFQCQGCSFEQLDQSVEVGTGGQWAEYSPTDSRVLSEEYFRLTSHSQCIWTDEIEPEPEPQPESEFERIVRVTGWVDLVRFVEIRPPGLVPSLVPVTSKMTELVAVGRRGCLTPRIGGGWAVEWDDGESEEMFDGFDRSSLGAPPKRGQHVPGTEVTLRGRNLNRPASPTASPRGVELRPIPDMSGRQCSVCAERFGLCQGTECAANDAQRHFFCAAHFNSAVLAPQVEPAALPDFRKRNGVVVCPFCRSLDTRYAKADIYKHATADNRAMYDDALENLSDERTKFAEREKEAAVREANQASQAAVRAERERAKAEQQRIRDAERALGQAMAKKAAEGAKQAAAKEQKKREAQQQKRQAQLEQQACLGPDRLTVELKDEERGGRNWTRIEQRVQESLPSHVVTALQYIDNSELRADFKRQRLIVAKKYGFDPQRGIGNIHNKKWQRVLNIQLGFHAMSGSPEELKKIYEAGRELGGFDLRLGRQGAYGRGSYFAHHAIYSAYLYPRPTPAADGSITMLCAEVILGNSKDYGTDCDGELLRAPEVPGEPGKTYDSVQGTESGFGIHGNRGSHRDRAKRYGRNSAGREEDARQYIVFEKAAAYPSYLVTIKPAQG